MRSRAVVVASVLGAALVSGGWLMQRGFSDGGASAFERARLFDDVMRHVKVNYVDTVSDAALYEKAVQGMLHQLHDPHSTFLEPQRLARLTEQTTGRYAGVGIQIDVRDVGVVVIAPLPGTPAEEAGMQTGDRIVLIDHRSTAGLTSEEALKLLRGPAGSKVTLGVERPGVGERLAFNVTRREIQVHSVQHAVTLRDGVGYVDLTAFAEDSYDDLRQSIDSLRTAGARSLILDLRSNPGGLLEQGVAVSDLFLDQGQKIVSTRGRTREANTEFSDRAPQLFPGLPLVVLVDSGSASASEIVAGALQDHDRAVLVGTTTYGKGSAQSLFPMQGGAALKLTTALWYTPSGRSINRGRSHPTGDEDEDEDSPFIVADTSKPRPKFETDAGRTVLGGGGIAPDLEVGDNPLGAREREFEQALGKKVPQFRDALSAYALSLKAQRAVQTPQFSVTPAMLAGLYGEMQRRGVEVDRATYDAVSPLISRLLGYQVTQFAFGRQAEFVRRAADDPALQAALDLLAGAKDEAELFERAKRASEQKAAKKTAAAAWRPRDGQGILG